MGYTWTCLQMYFPTPTYMLATHYSNLIFFLGDANCLPCSVLGPFGEESENNIFGVYPPSRNPQESED